MSSLFEPGFFGSPQVRTALVIGGVTAVVSAIVGVFTVLRGQSFAGHALTDASATGGAGGLLVGVNPLAGFVVGSIAGAGAMEAVGVRHVRGRDLATGIVLGASIGLASLFLYLTTSSTATTGATQQILFGSIFVTGSSTVPVVGVFSVLCIGLVAAIYRPLLLSSVNSDIAAAKGVPVRIVGMVYMGALALAVGLSSLAIGAVLSTALLIGPAATALRLTRGVGRALALSCVIGVATTWLGVLVAYDSADWGSGHDTLPVSFCVVGLIFLAYMTSGLVSRAGITISGRSRAVETAGDCVEDLPLRPVLEEEACSRGS
ncbi:MAG: metal ABC transporter permease [Acidimicrobiales bacterium]